MGLQLLCTTFRCFCPKDRCGHGPMGSIPHYLQTQPAGATPASQACATGSAGTMMFRAEVSCPAATQAWEACLENDHNKRVENHPMNPACMAAASPDFRITSSRHSMRFRPSHCTLKTVSGDDQKIWKSPVAVTS